jgi:hypothetical protein
MAFDGKNLWIANYYDEDNTTSTNDVSSILKVVINYVPATPTDPGATTETFTNLAAPANTYKPNDILFDGKYLWTANMGNIISGVSDGSVSKWIFNQDGSLTEENYPVNTYGEQPLYLTFDGTYIWVATGRRVSAPYPDTDNTYITKFRASDGQDRNSYLLANWIQPETITFDGSSVWLANLDGGLFKFYTGSDYGQQSIEQAVRLQNIVPGYTDGGGSDTFKHFNISGEGTVTADVVVGGNVSAPNNLWGGSSNTEVPISGQGSYNCPDGYFVMDIQLDSITGKPTKLLCRPL